VSNKFKRLLVSFARIFLGALIAFLGTSGLQPYLVSQTPGYIWHAYDGELVPVPGGPYYLKWYITHGQQATK
jgi:hypothetical protein